MRHKMVFAVVFATTTFFTAPAASQFNVTVDATALTVSEFQIGGLGAFNTDTVRKFNLAPADYLLFYGSSNRPGGGAFNGQFEFTLTVSGTVDYDPLLDLVLAGRGSRTLTVLSPTIDVDATALTIPEVSAGFVATFPTAAPIAFETGL